MDFAFSLFFILILIEPSRGSKSCSSQSPFFIRKANCVRVDMAALSGTFGEPLGTLPFVVLFVGSA